MKILSIVGTIVLAATLGVACSSGGESEGGGKAPPPASGQAQRGRAAEQAARTGGKAAAPLVLPSPSSDEPGALTAFADVDELIGDVPHTVKLDVDVIDGTGHPPFTYVWDFGDATPPSHEKAPTHTYKIPGSFRASVIVTDSKGEVDQDYVDITVNEDVDYTITPEQLREMLPVEKIVKQAQKKGKKAPGGPAAAKPGAGGGAGAAAPAGGPH